MYTAVAPVLRKKRPPPTPTPEGRNVSPFAQVGMALGLAMVSDGRRADRPPQGLTTSDEGACCLDLRQGGVVAHQADDVGVHQARLHHHPVGALVINDNYFCRADDN